MPPFSNQCLLEASNCNLQFSSVTQLCPTLQPHRLQHARPPCPSPTPGVYSNSCPFSQCCHPTISSSVIPFSSAHNLSQHQSLSNESVLHIRWPEYWSFSFSISPSNEYSGLISFRIDWSPRSGRGYTGTGGALGDDKFIMLTVVMVLWIHVYVKTYQILPFKYVYFMSLYFNKAKTIFVIKMSGSQIS